MVWNQEIMSRRKNNLTQFTALKVSSICYFKQTPRNLLAFWYPAKVISLVGDDDGLLLGH